MIHPPRRAFRRGALAPIPRFVMYGRMPRLPHAARCTAPPGGREFSHGTNVQYSRHCPMPRSPNAARGTIPPHQRRRVARTDRSGSAAGPCGRALQEQRGKADDGGPHVWPHSGLCRTAQGNSHILPRVIGSVTCPWLRLVSLALPHFHRPGAAGPRERAIRSHGSCRFSEPRPADAAYG